MATRGTGSRASTVRLNDVDWEILEVMSDGRRYTQQHLYDDVEDLDEHSPDWIRQRVSHLHDTGLIEKVGTSRMYVISDYGSAALELRERGEIDDDMTPQELGNLVRSFADE